MIADLTHAPDEVEVERFWKKFLIAFQEVCLELDADPATISPHELSAGLDRLAQAQEDAA